MRQATTAHGKPSPASIRPITMKPSRLSKRAWTRRVFLALLLCRLPFLLLYYPGCIYGDTASSIEQFFGYADITAALSSTDPTLVLNNHHPLACTLLFGGTVALGNLIGSQGLAVFLFLLAQAAAQSWLLARLLRFVRTRSRLPVAVPLAFYLLFPVYGIWSTMLLKDALLSLATTWLLLFLGAIAATGARIAARPRFLGGFGLALLAFMLSKNHCIYIVAPLSLYILYVYRRRALRLLLPLAASMGAYRLLLALLPLFHVAPAGRQETCGFMFQQTAALLHEDSSAATPGERAAIAALLPDSALRAYTPGLQDPVKFRYNVAATDEDFRRYFAAWRDMGLRHPGAYLRSLWRDCDAYFHPTARHPLAYRDFAPARAGLPQLYRMEPLLEQAPVGMDAVLRVPGLSLLFDMGFYVPLLLLLCLRMALRRDHAALLFAFPALATAGILLLAPQNGCFRYVMPIVWTLPLVAAYSFRRERKVTPRVTQGNISCYQK